ncbi:MAG: electron transfer flavoprotein subunit alpha/FixB family protein, partial [Spirochaetales bacterium]|nr:electron transfer flavoprotein subunit alpha/FixB family protein [Spirochaetales bacterium]
MDEVWTLSEYGEHGLKDVSYELLFRGRALADSLSVKLAAVVLGHGIERAALQSLIEAGADVVYVADSGHLADFTCESYARVLVSLIEEHKPQVMIAGATTTGRTLMPYVAVQVHAGLTADCTELAIEEGTGNLLQTRPAIGGNI